MRFNNFRQGFLPSLGISYRDFEQMMRNDLRIQRTIEALSSGLLIEDSQVEEQLNRDFGINSVEIAELSVDPSGINTDVSDEILRPIYESRKEQLLSPETRTFLSVKFGFDPADTNSRLNARDAAVNFSIALLDDKGVAVQDFAATASEAGLQVEKLGPLSQQESAENTDLTTILSEGFRLTKESPDSNAIETKDAFYIIRFLESGGREQLSFEQAREQLKQDYLRQQALSSAFTRAQTVRSKILEGLAEGKKFRDIALAENLEVREVPRLVASEAMDSGDFEQIRLASAVSALAPGEVSQPQSFGESVKLIFLSERKPADEPETLRATIRERLYQRARDQVLAEWLADTLRGDTRLDIKL